MKTLQPNFEKVKTAFYETFEGSKEAEICILRETINAGRLLDTFYNRKILFNKEFNEWLNKLDIRSVTQLIDAITKSKKPSSLPSWIKHKSFVIEYNRNGMLDLIRFY